MTTSSDRILLRWVPLAALLAMAMAVGLSFGPHPFGFHGWPKATAPRSVDRVVRVTPERAPVTVARREPGTPSRAADRDASGRRDASRATRASHAGPGERSSRGPSRRRAPGDRRSRPDRVPVPATGGGDAPVVETPDAPPVVETPDPLPDGAEAKPDVEPVTPPPSGVEVRDALDHDEYDFEYRGAGEYDDGGRHRRGHGHGHHGRHGGHGRH